MRRGVGGSGSGPTWEAEKAWMRYSTSRGEVSGAAPAVAATTPALAMSSIGRSSATKSPRSAPLAFGAGDEFGEPAKRVVTLGLELLGGGERLGEHIGEPAVAGLHGADGADVATEPVPGVGVGQGGLDQGGVLGHRVREGRGDQLFAGGKPAEQGRHPDPGAAGDLVQRRVQPVLGEDLAGRLDDPRSVALRVRAQCRVASWTWSLRPAGPSMARNLPFKWNMRSIYV